MGGGRDLEKQFERTRAMRRFIVERMAGSTPVHPPTQEATAVKPWRKNAQRVSSVALAKEDMLRRVSPNKLQGPRL